MLKFLYTIAFVDHADYKITGRVFKVNDSEDNKILRAHGKLITDFSPELKALLDQMNQIMIQSDGIGIAAQQVGLTFRCCVIDVTPCLEKDETCLFNGTDTKIRDLMPLQCCNPEILESFGSCHFSEGCLSVPEFNADVVRPEFISAKYQDPSENWQYIKCGGILARCMQHEFDHLDGIVFIDKLSPANQKKYQRFCANRK